LIRVVVPDSHGSMIDKAAAAAFLADLKRLDPDEMVFLGDHIDAGGLFSKHAPLAREDLEYSYAQDVLAANEFLDGVQKAAPRARAHYLEGNHEWHVERWAVQTIANKDDAELVVDALSPYRLLRLKDRGFKFYRHLSKYQGLAIPNTIRLGRCYFTHGIKANKYATASHVEAFGACVVHGHTHRAQEHKIKTITSEAIGGWCPGTLAQLQPTYMHTNPTSWTHGYGLQFVSKGSGRFLHINVPIVGGVSLLMPMFEDLKRKKGA
jgi:UDP-2,3-diacylglucosamine pyrophosphatase LpxH